ncbi:ras guanine nucleotide exchange factor domain-containing protein [Chytriomyces cf. hyalinus JEL632]|nr:ras guanine nucleotide exchange factor domain-containing protein [Chytriomyces cf. hyalinus JEL632]
MSITAALAAISPPTRRLSELDPTSVAKQLTLLEHNHFRKIKIDEFFMQSWSKKKDGGVGANAASKSRLVTFINWFNRVAYGIATEVVKLTVLKERVVMLKRLIFVAEICVKWNNFNTAFEIVAGLNLGPVSRLAKTWKAMPAKYMDAWNKLNRIVSSESSYRTYRQLIAQIKEQGASIPVLPYLGVNLSDLTFTEDGNPTYVTNDECSPGELIKIINFSKFKMISKLLSGILKFQSGQYDFEYDEHVQRWLRTEWEAASSKELYEMSLLCEPRIVST